MIPSLALVALVVGAAANPLRNIKNIVVLVQENRSFDHLAGSLNYSSAIDNHVNNKDKYCNPASVVKDLSNDSTVCAKPIAGNVSPQDPDHSITGGNMQVFGTYHPTINSKCTMDGFVTEQRLYWKKGVGNDLEKAAEVINYVPLEKIPILDALAQNYVLFDRWFAAIAGPTDANRAYLTSGTSHGLGGNEKDFYESKLPQKSIFQQLSEKKITWINYENATTSDDPFLPDASFYNWTHSTGKIETNVKPLDQFYIDAAAGNLPQFSYLNPECCNYMSQHPTSPLNMGENFMKGIYETLRNSPQWKETLFILTWDEHGGFADHVAPPTDVPQGDSIPYSEMADGKQYTYHFDRLGVRVPALLISPWVEKGVVQNKPKEQDRDFTHTSILKFLAEFWDLDMLSPRVEWSPSFSHLITNKFRDDTPKKLPNAYGYGIDGNSPGCSKSKGQHIWARCTRTDDGNGNPMLDVAHWSKGDDWCWLVERGDDQRLGCDKDSSYVDVSGRDLVCMDRDVPHHGGCGTGKGQAEED
ncbi:uncharacterized protein N7459_001163 [Penicillium hispanicum]|uniref:uncharacterized protein n=1 Tax=Penicillium hispanicum TaxID=1080232 RepID=UPI0025412BA9|nr:uncharacterized protein N7459_001163 [Penicillium hispanicum]KAJ5594955.1 hypothetical protein N7459_001163 [Penicillium hispanicum]